MSQSSLSAPCEACPPCCKQCAWDQASARSVVIPQRQLQVVRDETSYGCIRKHASIVVDQDEQKAYMKVGEDLLPLSRSFGHVIDGTPLASDIARTLRMN